MSINNPDVDDGNNINTIEPMDEITDNKISTYERNEKGKNKKTLIIIIIATIIIIAGGVVAYFIINKSNSKPPINPEAEEKDKDMEGYDEYDDLNINDTNLIEKYSNIDVDVLINQTEPIEILMNDSSIIKPITTKLKSRIIRLKNGLVVGMVSDPNIYKSGIAFGIPYGSNIDLIPGFAHYAEHLFFGGSKNYTDNTIFDKVVSHVSGNNNAMTGIDLTIYLFSTFSSEFNETLKVFADMVKFPNVNKSYADNEINAVNSEYLLNNITTRVFFDILYDIGNQNNPVNKLGIGTNETLKEMDIDSLLKNIHQYFRYCFRPKKMKVVIYSNKSLDDMQALVKEHFYFKKRKVLNSFTNIIKEKLYNLSNENLFEENKHQIAYYNIIENKNILFLTFQVLKNKQVREITILLRKIFLSKKNNTFLKKMEKYISLLQFSYQPTRAKQEIILVRILLTNEGKNNIEEIIKEFYSYLNKIKDIGINEKYWNNYADIINHQLKYELDSNVDPFNIAQNLVDNLLKEDYQNFLTGINLNYNKSNIDLFLNDLNTKNMIIIIHSDNDNILKNKNLFSENITEKKVKYFNVSTRFSTISSDFINTLNTIKSDIYELPQNNEYQSTKKPEDIKPCYETELKCEEDEYDNSTNYLPSQIIDLNNSYIINYKIDKSFHIPIIKSRIQIPFGYLGIDDKYALNVYSLYLNYEYQMGKLNELSINGISVSYSSNTNGFTIDISCYSDILGKVIDKVFNNLININQLEDYQRFYDYINYQLIESNDTQRKQINQMNSILYNFITNGIYGQINSQELKMLFSFTYEKLISTLKSLLTRVSPFTFTIVGDINKNEIKNIANNIANLIKPNINLASEYSRLIDEYTSVSLFTKSIYQYERESIVYKVFQMINLANIDILKLIIFDKCNSMTTFFNELRTKNQIGYSPRTQILNFDGTLYYMIGVNGVKYTPNEIDSIIDNTIEIALNSPCSDYEKVYQYLSMQDPIIINLNYRFNQIINPRNNLQISSNELLPFNYNDVIEFMKTQLREKPRLINLLLYSQLLSNELIDKEIELMKSKETDLNKKINKKLTTKDLNFLQYFSKIPNPGKPITPVAPYDSFKIIYSNSEINKPKNDYRKYEIIELNESKYNIILISDSKSIDGGIAIKSKYGKLTSIFDGFSDFSSNVFYYGNKNNLEVKNKLSQFNSTIYTHSDYSSTNFIFTNPNFIDLINLISIDIYNYTINNNYIENEIKLGDSKFYLYNYTDYNFLDILISNGNPEHPFSKTNTLFYGNSKIFNENKNNIYQYLNDYYKLLFKPENCIITLYGKYSIENLRYLSYQYFNKKIQPPSEDFMSLFNSEKNNLDKPLFINLGKIAHINRERESSLIEFYFAFKNNYTNINRVKLINDILNRDIISLKNNFESYATEIKTYLLLKSNENEIISIRVNLTEKGMNQIDTVIEFIFGEINMIKNKINQDFINNYIEIENIKFNHKETTHANFINDLNEITENYFINQKEILGNLSINLDMFKSYINNLNPNNVFIIIDSPISVNSKYCIFNGNSIKSKIYQFYYNITSISDENKKFLSEKIFNISNLENFTNYSKSINLSDKPCYEKSPYICSYKEYDPSSKLPYDLYIIRDEENIYCLNKIDRTYYIPFVKGFIQIQFNTNYIRNIINKETYPYLYLYFDSFRYQFLKSSLNIDNTFYIPEILTPAIQITYSTYNELLNTFQQFILDFFKNPISSDYFEILKNRYIVKKYDKKEYSYNELYEEMIKLFSRFITNDTVKFDLFTIDDMKKSNYSKFQDIYYSLNNITNHLFSLTFGDINTTESKNMSNNLFSIIQNKINPQIPNLKASEETIISIPEKSSIIYYNKTDNIYMIHSRILIMYEIKENSIKNYIIYISCVENIIKEYMKREKGLVYDIKISVKNLLKKYYLSIYAIGPIDELENIEIEINNAINKSFTITCSTTNIIKYLNLRKNNSFTSNEKLELLISKAINKEDTSTYENIEYDKLIQKLKIDLIDEPKRVVIFNYRGNISNEDFKNKIAKISKEYSLNENIKNNITDSIKYWKNLTNY